jgi:hypothetical protein
MSYPFPHEPPTIERRGREARSRCKCDECEREDARAVVVFNVVAAGSEENYDGTHSVCRRCLENALAMLSDPDLVKTRTPLTNSEHAARKLATEAHGFQKYDSGTEPYVVHLAEVRDVLVEFGWGGDTELLVAAWLHDIVEDTRVTRASIEEQFGGRVGKLVWSVTGEGKTRRERNEDAYAKMVEHPDSIILKLADRIANARASKQTSPDDLFLMYKSEHEAFKGRLHPDSSLVPRKDAMWVTLDRIYGEP